METLKTLTKAEEQIMQILWNLKEGVVKDVVEEFDEPKPAYTTVATVLTVLEKKGFVARKKVGNVNLFLPEISKMASAAVALALLCILLLINFLGS